jgi:hypothetical protein
VPLRAGASAERRLMEIAGIPLRDIILVLSGLAGIYFVFMLLRIAQIGRRRHVVEEIPNEAPEIGDEEDGDEEGEAEEFVPYVPHTVAPPAPARAAETPQGASFGVELMRSQVDQELRQLREEVATLREELVELKAARRVSPQYADAMALAQRGLTAQDLADRCGISLGEAELVWALSRGAKNFDEEDDYGAEHGHRH